MLKPVVILDHADPGKASFRCPYCGVMSTLCSIKWTFNDWICKNDNIDCGKTLFAKVEYTGSVGRELLKMGESNSS